MFKSKPDYRAFSDDGCGRDCVVFDNSIRNAIDRYAVGLLHEEGLEVIFRDIRSGRR